MSFVAGIAWLLTRSQPQLILCFAILIAIVLDGVASARALREVYVEIRNPSDALAGYPVTYEVRVTGVKRPVVLSPPSPLKPFAVTVVDSNPCYFTLPAPPRGIMRQFVLDVKSSGPLGLYDVSRRCRVSFTTPLFVGPPPVPHEVRWPYLQTMRLGLTPTSLHGHDLFRGVRAYVRGDARRDVHWPATAHHHHLMVKEHEGTGTIALRIVVQLPFFGSASDEACGRAAWLAEEGLRRGWLVHLVTVEPVGEAPPPPMLLRPNDLVAIFPPAPLAVRTVDLEVKTPHQVRRRLAAAAPGRPELGKWRGVTRVITLGTDEWQ
jgi:uncharacterized protein (DUF58 family)